MPPSILSSGRPLYRFTSTTQILPWAMAMWSMLALVRGRRRTCRPAHESEPIVRQSDDEPAKLPHF